VGPITDTYGGYSLVFNLVMLLNNLEDYATVASLMRQAFVSSSGNGTSRSSGGLLGSARFEPAIIVLGMQDHRHAIMQRLQHGAGLESDDGVAL
jgi:hypothetical protein